MGIEWDVKPAIAVAAEPLLVDNIDNVLKISWGSSRSMKWDGPY